MMVEIPELEGGAGPALREPDPQIPDNQLEQPGLEPRTDLPSPEEEP
jgi:hypothetical protein